MDKSSKKGWSNSLHDIKPVNIYERAEQSRVNPRYIGSGAMQGTQDVGSAGAAIDADNNRIMLNAPDGSSVGFGTIPGTEPEEFGFFSLDTHGKLIFKIVNGLLSMHDAASGVNTLQLGPLKDGTTNLAIAPPGQNVDDLLNG